MTRSFNRCEATRLDAQVPLPEFEIAFPLPGLITHPLKIRFVF
jgi:hypothetical protein